MVNAAGHDSRELILVVDDNSANRELLDSALSKQYRVVQAANGFEALDLVHREPVDLVLLDVMMPGLDGYEVCRELKSQAGDRFLPVLLLTALNAQEDRNRGLREGADDFLGKPIDQAELMLRVRAFLRIRRQEELIRQQLEEIRSIQELKDQLVALILHDLRNPLMALDGNLVLMSRRLNGHPDPKLGTRVQAALHACQRLKELADGVLDVQGLEAGQITPRLEPISVQRLVDGAANTLHGAAEAVQVSLTVAPIEDRTLLVDGKLVGRCIENLLANAIKYSPRDGAVTLAARHEDGRLWVAVSDRGPGIPENFKAKIFERFGSVESAHDGGRRGHGLGLHLVKLVAQAHGGAASVLDNPGGGSIFRLELPAPIVSASGDPAVADGARPAAPRLLVAR